MICAFFRKGYAAPDSFDIYHSCGGPAIPFAQEVFNEMNNRLFHRRKGFGFSYHYELIEANATEAEQDFINLLKTKNYDSLTPKEIKYLELWCMENQWKISKSLKQNCKIC